jgi:hypothetical protein
LKIWENRRIKADKYYTCFNEYCTGHLWKISKKYRINYSRPKNGLLWSAHAGIAHETIIYQFRVCEHNTIKRGSADILLVLNCYDKIIEEKIAADFIDAEN